MKFHGNILTKLNHKQTKHSETIFNKQNPTQIKCKHFETSKYKSGFSPFSKHPSLPTSSPPTAYCPEMHCNHIKTCCIMNKKENKS